MATLDSGDQASVAIKTWAEDGTPVVSLSGELDLTNAEQVRSVIEDTLAGEPARLVFDMSGVEFMDSSGYRTARHRRPEGPGRRAPQSGPYRPPSDRADRPRRDPAHHPMKTTRTFPPDVESITGARRFVLAAIGVATRDLRDVVSVMVSELAMNAVQHGRTPFEVTVEVIGPTLRVEVTDSGGGTARAQPLPVATSPRGRGLFIVDQLSDTWGVSPTQRDSSKIIWFTIALTAATDSSPRQSAATEPAPPAGTPARPQAQPPPNPPRHWPQPEPGPGPDQKGRPGRMLASHGCRALKTPGRVRVSPGRSRSDTRACPWPGNRDADKPAGGRQPAWHDSARVQVARAIHRLAGQGLLEAAV